MDIRDHFAGLAMQAIIQSDKYTEAAEHLSIVGDNIEIQEAIAMLAYAQAEYMIQIKNKLNKEKTDPIIEKPEEAIYKLPDVKGLISLEEHNAKGRAASTSMFSNEPQPNGIACPECGEELMDSNPMMTLTSMPAQKNVHCPKCKYTGYRIA
jgi:uncharacterized protein with PIN domain